MKATGTGRVDLHVLSSASNGTGSARNPWDLPASSTDPATAWCALRAAGMDLVTLTDLDCVDGVRRLLDAGLPGVFPSVRLTATFPEDGCHIQLVVLNFADHEFGELLRLRENVYDLVDWLTARRDRERLDRDLPPLASFVPHPLLNRHNRPHGRAGSLTLAHVEKALLLFDAFEVLNGESAANHNQLTRALLAQLDPTTLARLAARHGIEPRGETPWRKALVGGSNDTAGLRAGRTWTAFPHPAERPPTVADLIDALRAGRTEPAGDHGGALSLAHSKAKILHDATLPGTGVSPARPVTLRRSARTLLRLAFAPRSLRPGERLAMGAATWLHRLTAGHVPGVSRRSQRVDRAIAAEAIALFADAGFRHKLAEAASDDDRTFLVVGTLMDRVFANYVDRIARAARRDPVRTISESLGLASSTLALALPYALSFLHQGADSRLAREIRTSFRLRDAERIVLVTDTLFEVNGVARTIRRMIKESERRGIDFCVVTSLGSGERHLLDGDEELAGFVARGRLKVFTSPTNLDFPEYDELQIRFLPLLEFLRFVQDGGFTKMQISTPGTVGLTGLLVAKILQLETSSTYHTSFPEYVEDYTGDVNLEALTWKFMTLVYDSVDEVVVPSRFIGRLLTERGLRNERILILDRWADTERFHPRHRTPGYWRRFGIADEDRVVKFVYVGRVGVEKNLALLADAFRELCRSRADAHLIVVGDGPYRQQLQQRLDGLPVTFTGFLGGEELSKAIASADAKLFPSNTDTWGNAPLEAQASGLPVVVSDQGGPQELMVPGVTGFRIQARGTAELVAAMEQLMDRGTRERMGAAARAFVEANRIDEPFSAILDAEACRARQALGFRLDGLDEVVEQGRPVGSATTVPTSPGATATAIDR